MADNDLSTIRRVMEADLNGRAAYDAAMSAVTDRCCFCKQPLGADFAIAVYGPEERDPKNWCVHPHGPQARIVMPSAFAHISCVLDQDRDRLGLGGDLNDE